MTRARQYSAMLTSHELMLLALFRAIDKDDQRQIQGLLYRLTSSNPAALRFRDEGHALGVEHLDASVLRPFIEAARNVAGIQKRAA